MKAGLFALLLILLGLGSSRADNWRRADVYLIDWDTDTGSSLAPEQVRQWADYKQTFRDDATAVAFLLELPRLKPAKDHHSGDARLVVDLFDETMQRHTYYADTFSLRSGDNKFERNINEQFRRRMTRLAVHRILK